MIAKRPGGNNDAEGVIHRFHKRKSCVFHSIHRLSAIFSAESFTVRL